jgi:hypothetical protein
MKTYDETDGTDGVKAAEVHDLAARQKLHGLRGVRHRRPRSAGALAQRGDRGLEPFHPHGGRHRLLRQPALYLQSGPAAEDDEILPAYRDTAGGEAVCYIAPEKIVYCPQSTDASYLLAGAFDVSDAAPCEPVSILGAGGTVYMSQTNLYTPIRSISGGPSASDGDRE